ncbi:MAG: FAD-dependent oxidoreductase [Ferruginibacter sp.]|nr:FAD-dependent oxidoreductase [Ferruginibacter sp.]
MTKNKIYDIAIVGGGLAGLALAIQSAKAGYDVILFEKETYPFHKVCGEYVSMESWDFIESLGLQLKTLNLPLITKLNITAPNGKMIETNLLLGGFGISRYLLDNDLFKIAKMLGVQVQQSTKVDDVTFDNNIFSVTTSLHNIQAKIVAGSFGKRSNLDIKWNRNFAIKKRNKLNNYIGIKYHVQTNLPSNLISLHNFKNGYCGISKIEDNKYCLCYLTTAKQLKQNNNSIKLLEENILYKNKALKSIFENATFLFEQPCTIAQISFDKKETVANHILMLGDAAGMITPLCGNGMSMALHSSKIAFKQIELFLESKITRNKMEFAYQKEWENAFSNRMYAGRIIQNFFGKTWVTNLFIQCMEPFNKTISWLVKQTHGTPF